MLSKLYEESYKIFCDLIEQKIRQERGTKRPSLDELSEEAQDIARKSEEAIKKSVESIVRGGMILFKRLEEKQQDS